MKKQFAGILLSAFLLSGCASVPMTSLEESNHAKEFNKPSDGNAGLYVYRGKGLGTAIKKDIWVDGECLGESAPDTFFYREVKGDMEHTIATESEFSPNELLLTMKSGLNYFVKQYMKPGVFVGGANLERVEEAEAREDLQNISLAESGHCSE